jgi:predicted Zn-ribbon and HTH transcriptional regulator
LRSNLFKKFGFAILRFSGSGFSTPPPEILAERESICRACDQWDSEAFHSTGRCRKCGCSTWAKLRMATERCPLGKWEAVESKPETGVLKPKI